MSVVDKLAAILSRLSSIETRLTSLRGTGGGGGVAAHHATHEPGGADEIAVLPDHHTEHESSGGDAIKIDDLAAPDDNSDLNASAAKHGLLPKLSNVVTEFLNGQGAFSTPSGAPAAHHASHESGGGDAIKLDDLSTPDDNTDLNVSTAKHGLTPKAPNDTAKYLRGDGTWATVSAGASNVVKLWRPDAFPTSPAAQCDHFDDASLTGLTAFQAGGALSVAESDTFLKYTNTGDNAYLWRGHFKALPAGDFTIVCRVSTFFPWANYFSAGLCLFEDATNNPNTCKLYCWTREHPAGGNIMARITKLNNYASYAATPADYTYYGDGPSFLRIRRSGTTLYFDRSADGLNWVQQFTEAQWFTPAEFGFIIWNYTAATTGYAWFDFLFYKGSNDPSPGSMGALPEFWIT